MQLLLPIKPIREIFPMQIRRSVKQLLCLALSFLTIAGFIPVCSLSVSADAETDRLIADGVYCVSTAGGLYIDAIDAAYDYYGRAYVAAKSGMDGQDLLFSYNGDGTYCIYPQSDGGKYLFRYNQTSGAGFNIQKTKTAGEYCRFRLEDAGNGGFYIIPASLSASLFVSVSPTATNIGGKALTLEYDRGDGSAIWYFSGSPVRGISMSSSTLRVKLYSVGSVYSVLTPKYATEAVTYTSSDESIILVDDDGSFCALAEGTATVTASCAGYSDKCDVTVYDKSAFTWYSQHNMYTGGWNGGALSGLYFYSGGVFKRYIIDQYNGGADWMDEGCALCAVSMVLHNMGAVYRDGYDFRSNKTGNIEADPYTVSLANSYNSGSLTGTGTLYSNPILVNYGQIANSFYVDGSRVTVETSYYITRKAIKEAIDKNPQGVVIGMRNFLGQTHYLVFTECINPDDANPNNYRFICCDSADYDGADGDLVPFEDSISYKSLYYRYASIISMMVWSYEGADD